MSKADCVVVTTDVPDFIITLWWIFIAIVLVAGIILIIGAFLDKVLEHFQDRRAAYLRNKQRELELELLEKQKNGIQS